MPHWVGHTASIATAGEKEFKHVKSLASCNCMHRAFSVIYRTQICAAKSPYQSLS